MKNKFISLFIILTMVISSITFVSAEDAALTEKQKEAYEVLSVLGYIEEGYDEESLLSTGEVSRAEFAELTYKIFGNGMVSDTAYFYDVPSSHFAAKAISALVEMRLISVGEDRMFNPDRTITRDEAAKIICYALGYSALCEAMGGWTKGINAVSHDLELFEGVSSQQIKYIDMITLIYNALFAEVLEMVGIEGSSAIYEPRGETFLSQNKDIYINEGVVAGFDGIGVFGDAVLEGEALIGDLVLDANGIDLTSYLGMKVKYLYEYDEKNEILTLVWVKEHRNNEILDLNRFDNAIEFDPVTFVLRYINENERTKSISLSSNINVIYNGGYVTTGISEILSLNYYSIRLVSSNGDDYETAIIDDYENYILSTAESGGEVIYVQSCTGNRSGTSIDLSEYERVVMLDVAGNELTLEDIPVGAVVSVKRTVNKDRITIVLSTKTVSGKVSSISTNYDNYTVYEIDGNEYMLYDKNVNINVPLSSDITFMLDAYGYIAKGTLGAGAVQFGYLLKIYCDEFDFDNSLMFKMINSNGEVVKYNAAKNIYIDAIRYKEKPVQAFDSMGGKNWRPQIVAYYVNANDEINQIDTPEDEATAFKMDKDMFTIVGSGSYQYNYVSGNLGPKARVNEETLIYSIPDGLGSNEEESITVMKPSALYTWEPTPNMTFYAYGLDDWEFLNVVATTRSYFISKLSSEYMLVDKVKHVLNEDEEVVYAAEGYSMNGTVPISLEFDPSLDQRVSELQRGDFIHVTSAVGDSVTGFELYVDVSKDDFIIDESYETDETIATSFYVNKIIGSSMRLGYRSGADFDVVSPVPTSTVYVYDSENDYIDFGSAKDFVSYDVAGNNCSRVFWRVTNRSNMEVIIYK